MEFSALQISTLLGGTIEGDQNVLVSNYSKIEEGKPGCLTFFANPKYEHYIYETQASVVLVRKDFVPVKPLTTTLIKVEDPYATIAQLLNMIGAMQQQKHGLEEPHFIASGVDVPSDIYV